MRNDYPLGQENEKYLILDISSVFRITAFCNTAGDRKSSFFFTYLFRREFFSYKIDKSYSESVQGRASLAQ